MGAPKTRQQMADELNDLIDERFQELEELNQALDAILSRRRKRRRRSPLDPFALLEHLLNKAFQLLERAITRVVHAIVK